MARFVDAIDLPISIEDAFDYLADFANSADWDPGVADARRLTSGEIRLGSRFEVVVSFLGRQVPLEYEITAYQRPYRLVLTGADTSVCSIDEITFASRPGGTRVSYEARFELKGILSVADPLVDLLFPRIARVAARGLRERVGSEFAPGPHDHASPDGPHRAAT
jgi:hypothetical protein